ncbi:MAG TPA: cellulase family glycosylhydrolase [Trebonia sp.]
MGLLAGSRRRLLAVSAAVCALAAATAVPSAAAAAPGAKTIASFAPAAAPAAAAQAASVVLPAAPIGHAGRWITDATGKVLTVTGVNMVNKLTPYTPAADGFGDADAQFLAGNGFSAVRVGVIWKALEPQPGVFNDSYLASIASTVNTLGAHGIVSLLDFHQDMYNEQFQGEGAPDWAVDDDGLPAQPQLGFSGNYFFQPALQVAYDNFWDNVTVDGKGLQDWYAGAWAHVASYFKNSPYVLGYDVFNEPSPGTDIETCAVACPGMDAKLTAFYGKVSSAVRQVNTTTLLFDEPWLLFDVGLPSSPGATGDSETGLSFHDYCPFDDIASQLNFACPPSNDAVFGNAENVSDSTGDALLLTEFGATNDASVLSGVVSAAAKDRVGWLQWAFCGCGDPTGSPSTEGLVNNASAAPTGSNVNTGMLDALAVPYPELVAGTPDSYGYDTSAHVFTLSYSTERADGTAAFPAGSQTSVVVPAVQYPSGYEVTATGARVVSAGGVLTLASCPGATTVSVTVQPGSATAGSC